MAKYVMNIFSEEKNVATSKAKDDVAFFLKKSGFSIISINLFKNKLDKISRGIPFLIKLARQMRKNDIFVFQYPSYLGDWFDNQMIKLLLKKQVKTVAVVHDIDSYRFPYGSELTLKKEIYKLKRFDRVIASNKVMRKLLAKNGLRNMGTDIGIFDYRQVKSRSADPIFSINLVFAGNLNKSEFLFNYPEHLKSKLNLYGIEPKCPYKNNGILYRGVFKPEELINHFSEGFGLVWDGKTSNVVSGKMGKYLRINNPHKLSLYLSSGLPVVIWKDAALANFVKKNRVGILINSLDDVDIALGNVTEQNYKEMLENVKLISKKMVNGEYIKKAVYDTIYDLN